MTADLQTTKAARCACGARRKPEIETDVMTGSTIIECANCNRMVGAGSQVEARQMWNGAMKGIANG